MKAGLTAAVLSGNAEYRKTQRKRCETTLDKKHRKVLNYIVMGFCFAELKALQSRRMSWL